MRRAERAREGDREGDRGRGLGLRRTRIDSLFSAVMPLSRSHFARARRLAPASRRPHLCGVVRFASNSTAPGLGERIHVKKRDGTRCPPHRCTRSPCTRACVRSAPHGSVCARTPRAHLVVTHTCAGVRASQWPFCARGHVVLHLPSAGSSSGTSAAPSSPLAPPAHASQPRDRAHLGTQSATPGLRSPSPPACAVRRRASPSYHGGGSARNIQGCRSCASCSRRRRIACTRARRRGRTRRTWLWRAPGCHPDRACEAARDPRHRVRSAAPSAWYPRRCRWVQEQICVFHLTKRIDCIERAHAGLASQTLSSCQCQQPESRPHRTKQCYERSNRAMKEGVRHSPSQPVRCAASPVHVLVPLRHATARGGRTHRRRTSAGNARTRHARR